jgi:hypothetical protein
MNFAAKEPVVVFQKCEVHVSKHKSITLNSTYFIFKPWKGKINYQYVCIIHYKQAIKPVSRQL